MATRNWAEIGIEWEVEDVQKQFGDHATDRKVVGQAQLPRIVDIDKAAKAGIDILGWVNSSNSMRVRAQAIGRAAAGKIEAEALREQVFAALLGNRASVSTRTVTVTKRTLPAGVYEGNDENEFRSLYAAQLVDQGVDTDVALNIARTVTF
jgi:hypothetical protein